MYLGETIFKYLEIKYSQKDSRNKTDNNDMIHVDGKVKLFCTCWITECYTNL